MLILSPVLLLILTAILLVFLGWFRPKANYLWLIAAAGSFLSWVLVWILRTQIGEKQIVLNWANSGVLDISPAMQLDEISWTFALALSTLILAVILTDVSRAGEADWSSWAGSLAITALGILAVMAGNIETILILWVVIDFLDLLTLLFRVRGYKKQQGVILYFSTSFLGTMLVLWAVVISYSQNIHLTFENITPTINLLIIGAVGLRLGVFPLQAPFLRDAAQQRGLGTVIKIILPAASLSFLVKVAEVGVPIVLKPYLLLLAGLAAIYGAVAWARSKDEIRGRRFWILSLAAIAIASAIQAKPDAVLGWSLILIFSGAMIFLASVHTRSRLIVLILGIIALTTLPYSASQFASSLFIEPFNIILILFLIAYAILMAGFIRHTFTKSTEVTGVEPWVKVIYPLGLLILLLNHWLVETIFSYQIENSNNFQNLWPGLLIVIITSLIIFLEYRKINLPTFLFSGMEIIFSFDWFYEIVGRFFNFTGSILKFISSLLEGEGGILWAVLLVTLIFTIVFQLGISVGGI